MSDRPERPSNKRFLIVAVAVTGVVTAVVIFPFAWIFWGRSLPPALASWGQLGDYLGAMLGLVLSLATLLVLGYASWFLPSWIEDTRRASERTRTAVALAQLMYDREFYVHVVAPAWEIAVKWCWWEGDDGDQYRRQISGASFLFDDAPTSFMDEKQANSQPYQNLIRFHPHQMPYDWPLPGTAFQALSEHMALNIWTKFWCHLAILHQRELVDADVLRALFADWYASWRPFMMQYRHTGVHLLRLKAEREGAAREKEGSTGAAPIEPAGAASTFGFLDQLRAIENLLYAFDPTYGNAHSEAARAGKSIAQKVWQLHRAELARTSSG